MKKATNTPHRIDDYLQRIEEREKATRRKKALLLALGVIALLTAGGLFAFFNANKELRKYSIQELSKEIVTGIFDEDDSRIVVAHALGTDTIQNINEYQSLVDLFEGSDIQPAFYQSTNAEDTFSESENTENEDILQKFSIDISGSRMQGNQLIFTIEDYDPDVEYTLSFGTGYKRKVGRVSRYTYNGYGTYRLRLLASSEDRGSSIYTKSVKIEQKKAESTTSQRPQFTEVLTPSTENDTQTSEPEITDGATRDITEEEENVEEAVNNTEDNPSAIQAAPEEENAPEENENLEVEAEKLEDTITENDPPAEKEETVTSGPPTEDPNAIYFNADIMPEFPGGQAGLKRYFRRNYTYPKTARDQGIEGTVFVRFVVNADGSVSGISVLKGLGFGCDDEAIRLIRKMPKWIPGEHNGKRVPVYKTMPIGFKLFE
ncbi:MAG: energy transducer TonB [Bacteroidota bacterium]